MARGLPPEGAWVTVSASLRSAHVDLLDEARGSLTRSQWIRKVLLEALLRAPVAAKSPKTTAGRKAAGKSSSEDKRANHRCPVKGWCSVCGEMKGVKR